MQQSPFTLRQKLIDAVDEGYHVKDMATIVEVLGTLERLSVTKEMLETTRLGKTVNEFRKKINNDKLAKRAKALVKKWRDAVLEPGDSQQLVRPVNGNSLSSISEGPCPGPGGQHGSQHPLSSLGSLQQSYGSGIGYNSTSSSPKLSGSSSKVSPSGSQNSNSLSPRILTAVNSNSSSSRNGNRSNLDSGHRPLQSSATNVRNHGAMSSPLLGSASLSISSPSSTTYLKSKSPFGPTSSVYTLSSKSPLVTPNSPLSSSSSYAPNSEVVARTNAANKRLRKEDNIEIVLNSGPPSKKARTMLNGTGTGVGGTLDDPLTFDELSKDSIISRTSDHSDGSSKPVSNVSSSGAPLSAAPSPLTATQDSNLSPPLSVGGGANSSVSSAALIDKLSVAPAEIDASVGNGGAQEQFDGAAPSKRGRRRKTKVVMDSESLLREQIAKAQAEGKIKAIEKLSRESVDEDRSRSPDFLAEETLRRAQLAALSPDNLVIKNEIVEKYLKSQHELKAEMERQYLDAVARNEISLDDEETNDKPPSSTPIVETKSKSKKKKKKKDADNSFPPFPTEAEILARLPPIDPQILAEFQNYVYCTDPEDVDDQKEPKSEKETENPTNISTSLSSNNPPTLVGPKIDWGDSDEEDEDFEEVKIPDVMDQPTDEVDHQPMVTETLCPDITPIESVPKTVAVVIENLPMREVDASEVERLHADKINNLNGNTDKEGQFREWQETLAVESFNGDLLHILPYTIIDF